MAKLTTEQRVFVVTQLTLTPNVNVVENYFEPCQFFALYIQNEIQFHKIH